MRRFSFIPVLGGGVIALSQHDRFERVGVPWGAQGAGVRDPRRVSGCAGARCAACPCSRCVVLSDLKVCTPTWSRAALTALQPGDAKDEDLWIGGVQGFLMGGSGPVSGRNSSGW